MDYLTLKHIHAGFAYLTLLLFAVRFALFYVQPLLRRNRLLKILPHIIDTLLLVFALMLVFSAQFALSHGWLAAKVIGLLGYIGFGVMAIRGGKLWGFAGALLCYAYVYGVATTKTALSWLAYVL